MLRTETAQSIINDAISLGADFVDIFVENNLASVINFVDRKVKSIKSGTDFGVGIRVVFGEKALYGYANSVEAEELRRITRLLCALDQRKTGNTATSLGSKKIHRGHKISKGLDTFHGTAEKIEYLKKLDLAARRHDAIAQADLSAIQRWQQVEIFNSEGLHTQDERHYTRLSAQVIARDGDQQATGYWGPGGLQGWEVVEATSPEDIADRVCRRAVTVLRAGPCPAGRMPVIIDNGFGGVIFHEACGHLLETTSVEKKASVFHDKMGEQIAHEAVSAVDDGTIPGMWGSLNMDDEGMPVQKTELIKNGRLVGFLVDRMGHVKTGYARTGSGRRQSYKFAPASRMRNTFILPGTHSMDDLIRSVDRGLYAKSMGGGSVVPGTGEFNFAIEEAYLIENGKIGKPVKGATLIGTGPETLNKISMIANNFELSPGMCGSVSGSVPVTVGQAALKVDDILVGGQAQ